MSAEEGIVKLLDGVIGKEEANAHDLLEQLYFGTLKDPALVRGVAIHLWLQRRELCERIGRMESHVDDLTHCKRNMCNECDSCLRALEDEINR